MIAAFVPILEDLNNYCLFSTTLDMLELTAIMKRPEESATGSGLLAPFDNTVWFCVLTAVIVVGPTIYLFSLIRFVEKYKISILLALYYFIRSNN